MKQGRRELQEDQEVRENLVPMDTRETPVAQVPTERTVKMELMENLVLNLDKGENLDLKDLRDLRGLPENLVLMVRPEFLPQCWSLDLKGDLVEKENKES